WFDDQNMDGNIYERMAEGVQLSRVFVPCLSATYSSSDNCRREISFALDQKRKIVPLRLESNLPYQLGFMTSGLLCEYRTLLSHPSVRSSEILLDQSH